MRRPLLTLFALGACLAPHAGLAATPPKQPDKGPGGAEYVTTEVVRKAVGHTSAATFVFHAAGEPAGPRPVVVFLHSWGAPNPLFYGGWIEHLARRGNLVLFPRFQEVNRTRPADATATAAGLIKEALEALSQDPAARPDRDRLAYIGHLAGAPIALNLAAGAQAEGLPVPKLVFAVMPGGVASDEKARGIFLKDLSELDSSTLLIAMSGDRDYLPIDRTARRILKEATGIPANRKLFMRAVSDDHGFPTITATLASPGAPKGEYDAASIKVPPDPPRDPKQKGPVWRWSADMSLTGEQTVLTQQLGNNPIDSLDYLAYWKTFDMAEEAALSGRDASALKANSRFVDMGTWSDGWPVRRLTADLPKVEGQEETRPERGPRRRL
jgi:pimeloyl-ACP methyl ester carboxylesterase